MASRSISGDGRFLRIYHNYDLGSISFVCCRCVWTLLRFCHDDGPDFSLFGRDAVTVGYTAFGQSTQSWVWVLGCGRSMFGDDPISNSDHEIRVKVAAKLVVYEKQLSACRRNGLFLPP